MRICVDLDGTLCEIKKGNQRYEDVEPVFEVARIMQRLKQRGCYIIIHTARHMKTCGGNVDKVIELQQQLVIDWLNKHNIPYDELVFGKPYADVYVDDKAMKFKGSWDKTYHKLCNQFDYEQFDEATNERKLTDNS